MAHPAQGLSTYLYLGDYCARSLGRRRCASQPQTRARPRTLRVGRPSEGLFGLPEGFRASEQLGLQQAAQWTIMSKKDEGDDLEAKREREVCCSAPSACCCAVCCAVCCDGRCRTSAPGPFNPPAKGFIVRICAGRLRSGRSRSSSRSWKMHVGALPQLAAQ